MLPIQQNSDEVKTCEKCGIEKHPNEFYEKEKDERGNILRRDKVCKDCRRTERSSRYQKKSIKDVYQPKVLIEPERAVETEPNRLIEPEKVPEKQQVSTIDYSLWESLYGRNLTEMERLEIKTNLTDFFTVLIEEGQKQGLPIFSSQEKGCEL